MTINTELLQRTVQWAIDEDQRQHRNRHAAPAPIVLGNVAVPGIKWNQGTWAEGRPITPEGEENWCGTACCLAGNVAFIDYFSDTENGWKADEPDYRARPTYDRPDLEGLVDRWIRNVHYTESLLDIDEYATSRLGLTDEQADYLFDGDNSILQVVGISMALAELQGTPLTLDLKHLDRDDVQETVEAWMEDL